MARARLEDLGGLSRVQVQALRAVGVRNVVELRKAAYAPFGRSELAARSGIDPDSILDFARRADLCRVTGVGPEAANLLVSAGIGSVAELGAQQAPELAQNCLRSARGDSRDRRRMPSVGAIGRWIARASGLPPGFET